MSCEADSIVSYFRERDELLELLRTIRRILKPGGHLEWVEQSHTIENADGERVIPFITELLTRFKNLGRPVNVAPDLEVYLQEAGFEVGPVMTTKINFGDYEDLERRRFKAFIQRLSPGASIEAIGMVGIAMNQREQDDFTKL